MTTPGTASPPRAAVVVIDMQNDYCHPDGVFARAGLEIADLPSLTAAVNRVVAAGRAAGLPVIWVRMQWSGEGRVGLLGQRSPFLAREGLRAGTWGTEPVAGLDVRESDHLIIKERFSAFHQTGLDDLLAHLGAGSIVVTGVRTDFCVESTVRDAFFRDLDVVVATDAVAGYVEDMHQASLRLMGTVFARLYPSQEAVPAVLEGSRDPG